jgi:transcription elongation factor GreB
MSRYRPPAKPMSNYITPEGEAALSQELHYLWKEERPIITQSVSEAAAQGDRSENAEYIYGKKRLREIDRRVRFLRKRLENLTVVDKLPGDQNKIFFGAWVELLNEQDEILQYRLVGPDEINPEKHHISIDSPMGKTLLGKKTDDEIIIQSPSGTHHYEILKIQYFEPELSR